MYCRRCEYPLHGLDQHRCPECGLGFDPSRPWSFRKHKRRPLRRYAIRIVVLLLMVAVADFVYEVLIRPSGYRYVSVCLECGMTRDSRVVWYPYSETRFFTIHEAAEHRALSKVLYEHDIRRECDHVWCTSVSWRYGKSRSTMGHGPAHDRLFVVEDETVAVFMSQLCAHESEAEVEKWMTHLMREERGLRGVQWCLHELGYPDGGIDDEQAFKAWWRAVRDPMDRMMSCPVDEAYDVWWDMIFDK